MGNRTENKETRMEIDSNSELLVQTDFESAHALNS